ncbi:MAG: rRNA processing protein RimM [Frankiales bacterium]|nr:rRNA processing protein RimM [Frankiales bacterium]
MARVAGQRRNVPGPAPSKKEPDLIVVGRIGRPQGIKGEVTVEVRTDDPDDRFAPGRVLTTETGPLTVESSRMQGKYLVVAFQGVHDRNQAELLRDTMLQIDTADLPPLAEEDEYYDTQLIGLAAQLTDGAELGQVTDVLHLPGGDTLVVQHGEREVLVPFVKAIVPSVDLASGHLVVDPPEGLLDLA